MHPSIVADQRVTDCLLHRFRDLEGWSLATLGTAAARSTSACHLPEGPKGRGAGVPWSTTVLAAGTVADPSAVEGRAAVGGSAS